MRDLSTIFKAYDVRGIYPDQIDEELCRAIGSAVATFCQSTTLLMARDMRPSGTTLTAAFAEGANAVGVDVIDLGMASTDFLYFAAGTLDAPGAMFTASHNPAQYNGIKLCLSGARPIGRDTGLIVLELMSVSGMSLSEMLVPFQRYVASGEINTEVADPAGAVEAVAAHVEASGGTCDRLDGLTVDNGDWWFNLRPSNTEPLLRLNVEAPDEVSCAAHVAEVLDLVASLTTP